MVKQFEDQVYEGTLSQEFHDAVVYCQHIVGDMGMKPLGITCPKASARHIHALFQRSPIPKQMAFSGNIWMLGLYHRVQPVEKILFSRMRWALEQMVGKQSVNKVLGTVMVRAECSR